MLTAPPDPPAQLAELWEFPETLSPAVSERLAKRVARGGLGDPVMRAAGTAARAGSLEDLPLPVVTVPRGWTPGEGTIKLKVAFTTHRVRSANVLGRVRSKKGKGKRPVLIGAHLDHLGEGFPGADDNASGVAAALEAAAILSAHADVLGRDVIVAFFGAEEWGLRGSRAYVATTPEERAPMAVINADTVGARGLDKVYVLGISKHERLARAVTAAMGQSGFGPGKDIDARAYPHGSDHWPFHRAGIPAVTVWSGDYARMNTRHDTLDRVDPAKVTRIGRALALAALAWAGGY